MPRSGLVECVKAILRKPSNTVRSSWWIAGSEGTALGRGVKGMVVERKQEVVSGPDSSTTDETIRTSHTAIHLEIVHVHSPDANDDRTRKNEAWTPIFRPESQPPIGTPSDTLHSLLPAWQVPSSMERWLYGTMVLVGWGFEHYGALGPLRGHSLPWIRYGSIAYDYPSSLRGLSGRPLPYTHRRGLALYSSPSIFPHETTDTSGPRTVPTTLSLPFCTAQSSSTTVALVVTLVHHSLQARPDD
ncbi:hypothetical protein FB45DRAFT_872117 [Roridomyces roridus]|uniref:Uncharacterized protein n=1 Tax=Roridomyces roridus TaxID=1738132 RepID=A0AAD7FGJ4_9AGAR|nr:hypothetical protein FB45DRAFT_872117 [Roridomyces roridus]